MYVFQVARIVTTTTTAPWELFAFYLLQANVPLPQAHAGTRLRGGWAVCWKSGELKDRSWLEQVGPKTYSAVPRGRFIIMSFLCIFPAPPSCVVLSSTSQLGNQLSWTGDAASFGPYRVFALQLTVREQDELPLPE